METDGMLHCEEGRVPEDLRGTLYRNGPGRMQVFGERYQHPFDGDGMVTRFSFENGKVHFRNRFVRTKEYLEEEKAGRMLYRSFGTNLPGGLRANLFQSNFKNAANTSVLFQRDKLWALWEGGHPYRLDPKTLDTLGTDDFNGTLWDKRSRIAPALPFSAHPRVDPESAEIFNFGVQAGRRGTLWFYCLTPKGTLEVRRRIPLSAVTFIHDFTLTKNYAIFFDVPVRFQFMQALIGLKSPVEAITQHRRKATQILLVPRNGQGSVRRFAAPPGFVFHFSNAFEEHAESIIVDGLAMESFPAGALDVLDAKAISSFVYPAPVPTRYKIHLRDNRVETHKLDDRSGELPTINPSYVTKPYRYLWHLGGERQNTVPVFHRIRKQDLETQANDDIDFGMDLPSEPIIVPKSIPAHEKAHTTEDEVWVLTLVYIAKKHRSELQIFDGKNLKRVCRLALPLHVPPGFHGTWVPISG